LEDTKEGLAEFYKTLGQFLKTKCPASKAYVLIPDRELEKEIWFKPERRLMIDNGALEVAVSEYSIMPLREEALEKEPSGENESGISESAKSPAAPKKTKEAKSAKPAPAKLPPDQ
ncbi:MAG: hypothetical protein M3Y08_12775, partial [Fibrobacterota bacterium]|nr:hypothetical protein [Fibrobacterota bacterium]